MPRIILPPLDQISSLRLQWLLRGTRTSRQIQGYARFYDLALMGFANFRKSFFANYYSEIKSLEFDIQPLPATTLLSSTTSEHETKLHMKVWKINQICYLVVGAKAGGTSEERFREILQINVHRLDECASHLASCQAPLHTHCTNVHAFLSTLPHCSCNSPPLDCKHQPLFLQYFPGRSIHPIMQAALRLHR